MSLVALGGLPLVPVGAWARDLTANAGFQSDLQDAANESTHMIGRFVWEDGGTHTVDGTGSSSFGWAPGTVTLANAGTTFKIGLAAVDLATGPVGRAANAADVITFDVSASYTSAGAPTGNAWNEKVPSAGTKTIASGDLVAFCTQMTARGGVDAVNTRCVTSAATRALPHVTTFLGGSYSAPGQMPNVVITASDGTLGFFVGGVVASSFTSDSYNNTANPSERGNYLKFPVPVSVYGVYATSLAIANNCDLVLYADPLGTPAAQATISEDSNTVSNAGGGIYFGYFATPVQFAANAEMAVVAKPTTASNITLQRITFNAAAHQKAFSLGTNCYAVARQSGAFVAGNAGKERSCIGVLIGAFDDGLSAALRYRNNMAGNL